jgi:hypothetical protein
MHPGYAPTHSMATASLVTRRASTAPASAVPGTMRPGTLVTYFGSSEKDHGDWVLDGPCFCGCGGFQIWRQEHDGAHRLVHVSQASVSAWRRS